MILIPLYGKQKPKGKSKDKHKKPCKRDTFSCFYCTFAEKWGKR